MPEKARGVSGYNRPGRHIAHNHSAHADDTAAPNSQTLRTVQDWPR